ncbi:ketopantoate reductase PanE/ApbA C terminal-domain-containing protein [Mycena sanguinolenta]|nr:ketopantoate reductase PanE/ApbA C terminal-domain-containing protein [Mycena sanguinolenta]
MQDVLVFGLGAVGSAYAYILHAENQVRVSVVARSNASVIRENGLTLRSAKFGDHEGIRFNAVFSDCEEAAKSGLSFSYVVCANKAILDSDPSFEDLLRPVIGPDTVIFLIQNGIGQEDALCQAFPKTTIITSTVWTGARIVDAGVVQLFTRTDSLVVGVHWSPDIPRERQQGHMDLLADILTKSNASITVKEDVLPDRWVKVIWNSAWNSLTALTQLRTRDFIATSSSAQEVARAILSEGINVAKAKGIAIPEDTLDSMMVKYTTLGGSNSSMLTDALNEKPTEVESILGNIMREGDKLGVPVPTLRTVYALVKAMDWRHAHPMEARL